MNKKKKVVNTSIYPDEVIERLARCFYPAILECFNSGVLQLWSASTVKKANGPSPPGRRNRPDPFPKKNRTFPPGNALLYIRAANDFFQTSAPFGVRLSFCPSGNTRHGLARPAFWYGFGQGIAPWFSSPKKMKNPNPSPIGKRFGFCACGAPPGTRTLGPLIKRNREAFFVQTGILRKSVIFIKLSSFYPFLSVAFFA